MRRQLELWQDFRRRQKWIVRPDLMACKLCGGKVVMVLGKTALCEEHAPEVNEMDYANTLELIAALIEGHDGACPCCARIRQLPAVADVLKRRQMELEAALEAAKG